MNATLAFFIGRPGIPELIVILVTLLLLFGAKRLPELSRSIGRSINEFKKGKAEGATGDDKKAGHDETDKKQD